MCHLYPLSTTCLGLMPQKNEATFESDNKITLILAACIIAAGIAVLCIGEQTASMSLIGVDFVNDNLALKESMDAFLDYTSYNLDPQLKGFIFVLAWTFVKVFCFDIGGIVLALISGILFDNVLQGAIYSSFAATIGSSVAYYIAKLDKDRNLCTKNVLNIFVKMNFTEKATKI